MNKHILLNTLAIVMFTLTMCGTFANAATSTFNESLTTTGVSALPPSIPADLTAVPVSPTQIDLSWSPSIPNLYGVSGYMIFRDSVFFATTTSTIYSDTDLSPSTNYTYEVEAFDSTQQLSGLSLPVSTTTLSVPTYIPEAGNVVTSSGSSIPNLNLYNVKIDPSTNSATISFETNVATRGKLFWGVTPEFESVSLSGLFYANTHELQISSLVPSTKYYLRIQVADIFGRSIYIDYTFMTAGAVGVMPLSNPSDFKAIGYTDHVGLSWTNPLDSTFAKVRIVRSENFYPKDQYDGNPIYEGKASSYNDTDVVVGKKYYYAIFAESTDGAFSSGALAVAQVSEAGATNLNGNPFAGIEQSSSVDPMIDVLTLADFQFIQDAKVLDQMNGSIKVNAAEDLTIRLAYGKVPEILKNIVFSVADPHDATRAFTFLLRANKDKTYFEATIGPLDQTANYGLNVVVLDFQNRGLKKLNGTIEAYLFGNAGKTKGGVDLMAIIWIIVMAVIAFFLAMLLKRRDRKDEDAEGVDARISTKNEQQ